MKYILSREIARRFRGVARKCQVGGTRGLDPPVLISVAPCQLTMFANFPDVSLALKETTECFQTGTAIVPMSLLDHRGDAGDLGIALGSLKHKPLSKESEELVPPALPSEMSELSKEFLTALHEAGKSAAREEGKYAMIRVQLRGEAGEVNGTNGSQGLIQTGFKFPFEEDLLIPAVPVFGLKELSTQEDVKVGRTATHVVVGVGPWTIWLQIDTKGRFPPIAEAIPRSRSQTVLDFDEIEAAEVLNVIESLNRQDDYDPALTFDLKHGSCVRARNGSEAPVHCVPLVKSQITGPNVLAVANAFHVRRVLESGFRRIRFTGSERPWVAADDKRTYISASLGPAFLVPADTPAPVPKNGVVRVESLPNRLPPQVQEAVLSGVPALVGVVGSSLPALNGTVMSGHPILNGHSHLPSPMTEEPVDLLSEAEALQAATVELHSKATRLVNALRGFRKDRRTVRNGLASLRTVRQ